MKVMHVYYHQRPKPWLFFGYNAPSSFQFLHCPYMLRVQVEANRHYPSSLEQTIVQVLAPFVMFYATL
jgi:hypothetical protein